MQKDDLENAVNSNYYDTDQIQTLKTPGIFTLKIRDNYCFT